MLSWFKAQKVKDAKVLVVGAGALGNEVLKNLALFGIGNIVIVDFDKIEYSNLTRSVLFRTEDADKKSYKAVVAAQRIKELNPKIRALPINDKLETGVGLGLYRRMDAIIGCLDNLQSRILLNRLCYRAGKTWIDGAIGDLEGQVSVYQPGTSCYECNLTDEEKSDFDKRISCTGVVKINENAGRVATTPVSASIIAAVQMQEAMKLIHQEDALKPPAPIDKGFNPLANSQFSYPPLLEGAERIFTTLAGKLFVYEGMHPAFDVYDFANFDNNCTAHENWSPVIEILELSADTKIHQALQIIKTRLGVEQVEINLRNNKFVEKISSRITNINFTPMLPESKIPDYINQSKELSDIQANEGFYQNSFENINKDFQYLYFTLKQTGIPYFDVIQVSTENGIFYIELSKDKDKYERFFA